MTVYWSTDFCVVDIRLACFYQGMTSLERRLITKIYKWKIYRWASLFAVHSSIPQYSQIKRPRITRSACTVTKMQFRYWFLKYLIFIQQWKHVYKTIYLCHSLKKSCKTWNKINPICRFREWLIYCSHFVPSMISMDLWQ